MQDADVEAVITRIFHKFLKSLMTIDQQVSQGLGAHFVMDNCRSHKSQAVQNWFVHYLWFHVHFTPMPATWLNQVERCFTPSIQKQIGRGTHRSTQQLD